MSKSHAAGLAIQLLGDFRVLVRGDAVEDAQWSRPQAKVLVKLLALDPKHQQHRQQLIDAIWPDLDPESGAANLHKIIHLARRALEPKLTSGANSQFIVTSRQQVQLRSPGDLRIDVEEFERLSSDYCQAMVLAGLNDRSSACQRLERAVNERYDRLIYLNVEPIFDSLRGDSRFRALTSSLGLSESSLSA